MSVMKKTVEQLWMNGRSEDYIVNIVSIAKALNGKLCSQTARLTRRHVRSEIARLKRKGLRPNAHTSAGYSA